MKHLFFLLWLFLFFPWFLSAQQGLFESYRSRVDFVSDAPLELIKASSNQLRGFLDPQKKTFAFRIPSNSFDGFNSPLQKIHFNENYIEASRYPEATFKGKIIEQVDLAVDGDFMVRAKGALMIHGVEQERIIRVKLKLNKGVLFATAEFSILLQEHNISVPKVVNQKIAEDIFIKVEMEMVKK